jgi:hypothetical protein
LLFFISRTEPALLHLPRDLQERGRTVLARRRANRLAALTQAELQHWLRARSAQLHHTPHSEEDTEEREAVAAAVAPLNTTVVVEEETDTGVEGVLQLEEEEEEEAKNGSSAEDKTEAGPVLAAPEAPGWPTPATRRLSAAEAAARHETELLQKAGFPRRAVVAALQDTGGDLLQTLRLLVFVSGADSSAVAVADAGADAEADAPEELARLRLEEVESLQAILDPGQLELLHPLEAWVLHLPPPEGALVEAVPTPSLTPEPEPERELCRRFLKGRCPDGAACRWRHATPKELEEEARLRERVKPAAE